MALAAQRQGFSLIELLVALAILSVVAAIIVPKFLNVRQQAQDTVVQNNLKEITNQKNAWMDAGGIAPPTTDALAPFHVLEFLSQPGNPSDPTRGMTTTYGGAGIDPQNPCKDSGMSMNISIPVAVYNTKPTSASSGDGIYTQAPGPSAVVSGSLVPSPIQLYHKSGSQVYSLDEQGNDLATAVFIHTGVTVGFQNPVTLK